MPASIPLKTDVLPTRTRRIYERLAGDPLLGGFVLIGGTALSLQIGHRLSEDLDLTMIGKPLPEARLDRLLQNLEDEGYALESLVTRQERSVFRINRGERMERLIQDYRMDGAKVTFFSRKSPERPKRQIGALRQAITLPSHESEQGFCVLGIPGLFLTKALVLADRVKSRDLFDLMVLTRDHGYTLEDVFSSIQTYAPVRERDIEYYKSVLTGHVPLDKDDEGFESIGLDVPMEAIYEHFAARINLLERSFVARLAARRLDQDKLQG